MSRLLEEKVVLITGAAGGIGKASAELFAREGARLIVSDREVDDAQSVAERARELGAEALAVAADLEAPEQIEALMKRAVEEFGRLDGAFNNAGIGAGQVGQHSNKTAEWEDESFERIVRVNLFGTWHCMKQQIPIMLQQNGGSIVNTTSLAALAGFPTTAGYTASKHALIGLTKTAAMEYAPTIRVNALCPGYVDTPMVGEVLEKKGEEIRAKIPFGRVARPEEMAEVACWLLSDRSSYTTGSAVVADGGYMAG